MSNYKHFKHYYNPYDSLDVEWQHVVSKGYLTIGEIICLSGYTKSYIYRLVKNPHHLSESLLFPSMA